MSESTFTTITLSIDALFEIGIHASWASPDSDVQIRFLQWMANELQYQYGVDRDELTKVGFPEDTKESDLEEEDLEEEEETTTTTTS